MFFDWLRDFRQQLCSFRSVRRKAKRSIRSAEAFESRVLLSAFTVNTLVDVPDVNPGDGISDDGLGNSSLRAAIMEANALPGEDTVLLGPGLYALSLTGADEDAALTGDLDVTESLTIIGTGADTTIIDAAGLDRVFQVFSGASLNLSGLTITGGDVVGKGGGLYNEGHVSLQDSTVTGNSSADRGGGIYSATGADLNVADTTISNNTTDNRGGGIFSKGVLTIQGSSISGNTAGVRAG
jgi:predicted outer membrane repeat protein